jgi:hypothetical protein
MSDKRWMDPNGVEARMPLIRRSAGMLAALLCGLALAGCGVGDASMTPTTSSIETPNSTAAPPTSLNPDTAAQAAFVTFISRYGPDVLEFQAADSGKAPTPSNVEAHANILAGQVTTLASQVASFHWPSAAASDARTLVADLHRLVTALAKHGDPVTNASTVVLPALIAVQTDYRSLAVDVGHSLQAG